MSRHRDPRPCGPCHIEKQGQGHLATVQIELSGGGEQAARLLPQLQPVIKAAPGQTSRGLRGLAADPMMQPALENQCERVEAQLGAARRDLVGERVGAHPVQIGQPCQRARKLRLDGEPVGLGQKHGAARTAAGQHRQPCSRRVVELRDILPQHPGRCIGLQRAQDEPAAARAGDEPKDVKAAESSEPRARPCGRAPRAGGGSRR